MAFDGIVTRAVAQELSSALAQGRIDKIYQPERDELIFLIHTPMGKRKLYASCNNDHPGAFLTNDEYENPPEPPVFCMLLRKHLQNGRILDVSQKGAERIVEITVETRDEMGFLVEKKLIIEVMGRHSNIILIDKDSEKIIDSIKRISIDVSRARQILPGQKYDYPPLQDKVPFDSATEKDLDFKGMDPADGILAAIQGLSPTIAREIAWEDNPVAMYAQLRSMVASLEKQELQPAVYLREDGIPADFHVIPLKQFTEGFQQVTFDTVSEAISYYYTHRSTSNRIKQKSSGLSKSVTASLKKLYLKKQRLLEDIQRAGQSDTYRLYGELLTANLHQVEKGSNSVLLSNYYDGEDIRIPLDIRLDPSKNAQKYYKKYAKAKRSIKEKNIQLEETDMDISYLESVISFIDQASTMEEVDAIREELVETGFVKKKKKDKKKKKGGEKREPLAYTTSDGYKVLVGRNNRENDRLTFKLAGRKDVWFHTKDIPGSHVVLFTEGKEPSESAIFEAAALAAYHSKGRESENVPVDYTLIRYVKKPNGAKPGMVIFTHNKTVYVTPKLR